MGLNSRESQALLPGQHFIVSGSVHVPDCRKAVGRTLESGRLALQHCYCLWGMGRVLQMTL